MHSFVSAAVVVVVIADEKLLSHSRTAHTHTHTAKKTHIHSTKSPVCLDRRRRRLSSIISLFVGGLLIAWRTGGVVEHLARYLESSVYDFLHSVHSSSFKDIAAAHEMSKGSEHLLTNVSTRNLIYLSIMLGLPRSTVSTREKNCFNLFCRFFFKLCMDKRFKLPKHSPYSEHKHPIKRKD